MKNNKTIQARQKEKDPNTSGFLGIGEGKVAKAKADGAVAIEEAKRQTLITQANLAAGGYNPQADAAAAEAKSNNVTMYIVIGVVLILMVGLYFIIKTRK